MMKYPVNKLIVFDLEIYPNYFLFGCISSSGNYLQWDHTQASTIATYLKTVESEGYILCGFNNNSYDDVVLYEFLAHGETPAIAYQTSQAIIQGGLKRWNTDCNIESVDLFRILPGRMSLKKLGVVLGHHKLQELPIPWDRELTQPEMDIIRQYNINDLDITEKLLHELQPQLDLRATLSEKYGIDLRSSGEAQIAEQLLLVETGLNKRDLKTDESNLDFKVKPPTWWSSADPVIREIGDDLFSRTYSVRNYTMPSIDKVVYLGDRYYRMGIGGLHSIDGAGCWKPGPGETMGDWDITSMYPSIILTQELSPERWGNKFLPVYRSVVERRIKAKQTGDKVTADVLKIVANGTYGKLGDKYSPLYDPQMLLHVTLYGQLSLLQLIKMITDAGHRVVSANTDGVTVLQDFTVDLGNVVNDWEVITGLTMEYVPYTALYQQNINNYVAITTDGKVKVKGSLDYKVDLRKLPKARIIARAVTQHLLDGTPIRHTVMRETDINWFILAGTVDAGWETSCGDQKLGKVLRWYRSATPDLPRIMKTPTHDGIKGNAGQVSYTDHGVPVDDLPDQLPFDLDYQWYMDEANQMLVEITRPKLRGMNAFAEELIAQGLQPNVVEKKPRLSRASVERGDVDFDSIPEGHHMVVRTGNGIIALMRNDVVDKLGIVDKVYPAKTRDIVERDEGFKLIYGGSVPVPPWGLTLCHLPDLECWYTPAELKKVRE